jgi:hypothetical protein
VGIVASTAAPAPQTPASPDDTTAAENRVSCASQPGNREHCPANTSAGVSLLKSAGASPCLLGKTWGYDDTGIWVSDGCGGEFLAGPVAEQTTKEGDQGEIYFRLFSYARYLNQKGLQKFFAPFSGWSLTPKFCYDPYVWSSNPSQGDPAQVVGAGNLSYTFNRFVTFGAGITSLPAVRSTEGQFPYWPGVDDRLTADEFFRGSSTDGVCGCSSHSSTASRPR